MKPRPPTPAELARKLTAAGLTVLGDRDGLLLLSAPADRDPAGVLAQLIVGLARPSAANFPPRPLAQIWADGPLLSRLIPFIRDMSTLHLSILLAILAGSLVLVAFDHKNTRGQDEDVGLGPASLFALLITLGSVAWIEAASRSSLFAACDLRFGAVFGWLALVGLILAWLPAIRVGREAWRARD